MLGIKKVALAFREGTLLLGVLLHRKGGLLTTPRWRRGVPRSTTNMVRGREEATVCKGNSREDGSVVGGERWLKNGSSMYMYICLYREVYGAVLGCCGQSVC